MCAKSLAFAKIRLDALAAVRTVPAGRVTTFQEIGRVLEVMPRHIAYLLATLSPGEFTTVPWHRVVGRDGALSPQQFAARGPAHIQRLRREGVRIDARGRLEEWTAVAWTWPTPQEKIGARPHGPYADPATPLRFASPPDAISAPRKKKPKMPRPAQTSRRAQP